MQQTRDWIESLIVIYIETIKTQLLDVFLWLLTKLTSHYDNQHGNVLSRTMLTN